MGWFVIDIISSKVSAENLNNLKEFPIAVDEEFFLVEATSEDDLDLKINTIVTSYSELEDTPYYKPETRERINDRLAENKEVFEGDGMAISKVLGIRRIFPLSKDPSGMYDRNTNVPEDGSYIITSRYKVKSLEDLKKFMKGKPIVFTYLSDHKINLAKNAKFTYYRSD